MLTLDKYLSSEDIVCLPHFSEEEVELLKKEKLKQVSAMYRLRNKCDAEVAQLAIDWWLNFGSK